VLVLNKAIFFGFPIRARSIIFPTPRGFSTSIIHSLRPGMGKEHLLFRSPFMRHGLTLVSTLAPVAKSARAAASGSSFLDWVDSR